MKIISPFKDYYDYVAHIYGEDEKHTYLRPQSLTLPDEFVEEEVPKRLEGMGKIYSAGMRYSITPPHHQESRFLYHRWQEFYDFTKKFPTSVLSFCGYAIPLVTDVEKGKTFVIHNKEVWKKIHLNIYTEDEIDKIFASKTWPSRSLYYPPNFETRSDQLVELSRKIKQPVFFAPSYYNSNKGRTQLFFRTTQVPNLSTIDFPKLLSPEKAYQEIDYFVGNLMNPSPDLDPPAEVSDRDKIIQHGFDLKTSFRKTKSK